MKRLSSTLLFLLLAPCLLASTALKPEDLAGKRVVFLGDSITHQGTWVSFLQYYLLREKPGLEFDFISVGLASETASGLTEEDHPFPRPCIHTRLDKVLAATKPDVLIACYGMNDGIYHPAGPERERAYHKGIMKLVDKAKAVGVGKVILLSPGTFEGKNTVTEGPYGYKRPHAEYDNVLAGYAKWIRSLNLPGVIGIDIHTPMSSYANEKRETNPDFVLAKDGVHPQPIGHFVMAHGVLSQLGIKARNDHESELKIVTADPLYKLTNDHRTIRSKGWLPYIGYTRGKTFKTDSIEETEEKAAALMTQINHRRRMP